MVAIVFGVCGLAALLTGGELPDLYLGLGNAVFSYGPSPREWSRPTAGLLRHHQRTGPDVRRALEWHSDRCTGE
jgi:hypothetical protein